ncbi:MAG: TrbI/VirB10 family protein [Treponema sp.]|jgi:type IV secretory pathway VirB10-like protein|nr:TrbI/VirB10 family protein [Treponema sp.]
MVPDVNEVFSAREGNDADFMDERNETLQQYESQQVSPDLFGTAEQDTGGENAADAGKGQSKKTFAELRKNRSIPRLKKNQILAGLLAFVVGFLLLFNLLLGKKGKQKQNGLSGREGQIVYNAEFSLGDMPERAPAPRDVDDLLAADVSAIEASNRFRSPPSYENFETRQQEQGIRAQGMGAAENGKYSQAGYSESDVQALSASIRKDGGYGQSPAAPNQNNPAAQPDIPSREDYTRQQFDNYTRLIQAANDAGANAQQAQGINNGRYSEAGSYNPNNSDAGNFRFLEDNVIVPGTVIHAVLVSRIDTDYPGPIHARVTENVYDSKTGNNLLIPQGTILQGNYSSSSVGVAKVQIAWESMVVNFEGVAYQVSLGGMAGVDRRGRAGINGWLDDHYFEWLKAAGIVTLFTMLNSEMAYQTKAQSNSQLRQLMDINQGIVNELGGRIMDRAMNIQPSVKVPNGKAVSVSVNAPLSLRPFKAFKAEQKWIRS